MKSTHFRNGQPRPPSRSLGGRPINQSKMLAHLNGDKTYEGKRCKKCGATERYTRGGGSCVACQRVTAAVLRAVAKQAMAQAHEAALDNVEQVVETMVDDDLEAILGPEPTISIQFEGECSASNVGAAFLGLGPYSFVDVMVDIDGNDAHEQATPVGSVRYFWHPESGALFTTEGEYPESDGLLEEVDPEKYQTLQQEACFLGAGECPTPDHCGEGSDCPVCAGAPRTAAAPPADDFEVIVGYICTTCGVIDAHKPGCAEAGPAPCAMCDRIGEHEVGCPAMKEPNVNHEPESEPDDPDGSHDELDSEAEPRYTEPWD